jgi:hypothetical protein
MNFGLRIFATQNYHYFFLAKNPNFSIIFSFCLFIVKVCVTLSIASVSNGVVCGDKSNGVEWRESGEKKKIKGCLIIISKQNSEQYFCVKDS